MSTQNQSLIAKLIALLFGPKNLKASAASALAIVASTQASIKAEEARLAKLKNNAVITAAEALRNLQSDAEAAATAEAEAETARVETITSFDDASAAQVAALERKLAALKARRAGDRTNLEAELNDERQEAAAEATEATAAEAQIALAIDALYEGANAQAGLNNAD
jgi:acyl-coenzyme A synthetase/AMP-(fatty) acid ligase